MELRFYDFYIYTVGKVSFNFSRDGKVLIIGADEFPIDANELMLAWSEFHKEWDRFHT